MAPTLARRIAFALVLVTSAPVLAHADLLKPSPRALAAADGDEPPPHVDPAKLRKPEPKKVELDDSPVYKKWWFWVVTAAVVGGTIAYGALTFTPAEARPHACPPSTRVCFGDGRAQ
jgi:hypothetical protein